MTDVPLTKVVLAAKALPKMGRVSLLLAGKVPLLLLGVVAALALLVTLLLVGLAVTLSLIFGQLAFHQVRPKSSGR